MEQTTLEQEVRADPFGCQNTGCDGYSTLQEHLRAADAKAEIGGAQEFLPEGITLTEITNVPYGCQDCPIGYIGEVASQPGVEDITRQNGTTTFRYGGHQFELGPKGIKELGSSNGWVKVQGSDQVIDVKETIACIR